MRESTSILRTTICALGTLAVSAALYSPAAAQSESGIQMTPDSKRYLISKDVGAERWAISFNLDDRTATGNVLKTDGTPTSFIWCEITDEISSANPADIQYVMDCFGADACAQAPCTEGGWELIASDLTIGGDFMLPDGTRSTFSGNVEPIYNQSCALAGCHSGPMPAEALNLEQGQAYDNTVLKVSVQDEEGHFLVEPFDPSASHLFLKVAGLEDDGEQMPLGGPPLSDALQEALSDWILEGAARN